MDQKNSSGLPEGLAVGWYIFLVHFLILAKFYLTLFITVKLYPCQNSERSN